MERAAHPPKEEEHAQPQPVPRDPDLPSLSDTPLMIFAGAALLATLLALLLLV